MKRGRKLLKMLLLTVVMVMTMVVGAVTASADSKMSASIIQTGEDWKGSITVTKYASSNRLEKGFATGTSADTDAGIAEGYNKLNGARFSLYQVVSEADTIAYYNGNDSAEYDVAQFYTEDATKGFTIHKRVVNSEEVVGALNPVYKGEMTTAGTGENAGTCTFYNLDVGMYVLIETTDTVDQVTPLADPTLISIPMVNTSVSDESGTVTQGSNNYDNAEWLYDVKVYPKNHTSTGKLVLTKTDGNDRAITGEVKFKLERYNSTITEENKWVVVPNTYTVDNLGTAKNTDVLDTAGIIKITNGTVTIDHLPSGLTGTRYRITEQSAPSGYIVNTDPIYFKVNIDNTITYDSDNKNSGVIYTNTKDEDHTTYEKNADGTLTENKTNTLYLTLRNDDPDLTKKVKQNGSDKWVDATQYSIGDVIDYQITVDVPDVLSNDIIFDTVTGKKSKEGAASLNFFEVSDQLESGLSYVRDQNNVFKVILECHDPKNGYFCSIESNDPSYTSALKMVGQNSFTLDFKKFPGDVQYQIAGKKVTLSYQAFLNKDAKIATLATQEQEKANKNSASLRFPRVTNKTASDPTTDADTIKDETAVYTYSFKLTKRKDSATGDPISGVQFELYDGNTKLNVVEESVGVYRLWDQRETTTNTTILTTAPEQKDEKDNPDKGTILIKGLENKAYSLKEIKTIEGYNLLSKNFDIRVNVESLSNPADGKDYSDVDYNANGEKDKWIYVSSTHNRVKSGDTPDTDDATIINRKGFTLPQTGALGYLSVYAIGAVLVVGGIFLFLSDRRKRIR